MLELKGTVENLGKASRVWWSGRIWRDPDAALKRRSV